jgi:hypothetical protein
VFSGKSLQDGAPLRLVAPMGVTLTGAGLESLGQEPHTQASVYGVKGQEYKVEIQGTGTLRAAQEAMEEDAGPSIEQILPRIYTKVYWIVGLGLGVLALGFILLYRRSSLMPPSSNSHPTTPRDKHR